MSASPIRVGVLFDYPPPLGNQYFEAGFPVGLDEVVRTGRLDVPVEVVTRQSVGLPMGSASDVSRAFAELDREGVLVVVGPSISDNSVVIRDDAAAARLPVLNWAGGEQARGEWMFHYPIGSLGDEPPILAARLAERSLGHPAVVHDDSIVGRSYRDHFSAAAVRVGLEIAGAAAIDPVATDVRAQLQDLWSSGPNALLYFGVGESSRALALALADLGWDVPVLACSALMYGYVMPGWRAGFEGWEYLDTVSDDNRVRAALARQSEDAAAHPVSCGAYDIGRLIGEGLARAPELSRAGVAEGLRLVKQLPAASGYDGTLMGFGVWDHAALKGPFLVLRTWRDGQSVQVAR
ncbi:MAG: ABC transporter substrate-binding protein [Deltaproteobacteria bacterium]|nr:ABC transporter substrate-binding protein [Deltaproteobacteria bacterium]